MALFRDNSPPPPPQKKTYFTSESDVFIHTTFTENSFKKRDAGRKNNKNEGSANKKTTTTASCYFSAPPDLPRLFCFLQEAPRRFLATFLSFLLSLHFPDFPASRKDCATFAPIRTPGPGKINKNTPSFPAIFFPPFGDEIKKTPVVLISGRVSFNQERGRRNKLKKEKRPPHPCMYRVLKLFPIDRQGTP